MLQYSSLKILSSWNLFIWPLPAQDPRKSISFIFIFDYWIKFQVICSLVLKLCNTLPLLANFYNHFFQHWIRLEMQPDMVISKLVMRVDPNDSSYIPSLLVISGGDSVVSLKEIKSVHTPPNEAQVTLLQDMTEVNWGCHCSNFIVNNCLFLLSS